MILEEPKVYVEEYDPLKIMRNIERAMRTCYRSEGTITQDSYKRLLKMAIDSGHESVMEHEKITVKLRCSVGTYKDLTRHRVGTAWSIESTRWCNYAKDKFDNQIHFIIPTNYDKSWHDANYTGEAFTSEQLKSEIWYDAMENIEESYIRGAAAGMKPDELRLMLPHSTAADVVMTCNIREWRHILKLRTQVNVHPEIRQLLIPLLLKFQYTMPELFGDIKYDENFPPKLYATVDML